jgi:hypothetical protein
MMLLLFIVLYPKKKIRGHRGRDRMEFTTTYAISAEWRGKFSLKTGISV